MSSLIWLMVLYCSTIVSSHKPSNFVILAGQSKLAGRGGITNNQNQWDKVVPPEDKPGPQINAGLELKLEEVRDPNVLRQHCFDKGSQHGCDRVGSLRCRRNRTRLVGPGNETG